MKKITMELVKDFNGKYYLNLSIENELIIGLPEYVNYKTIKTAVSEKCQLALPPITAFKFEKFGRKQYATLIGHA